MRPLVIPTITDRCLQALVNLVLEPLVEMNSDKHSYGFRKYRSAKMAVGALLFFLRRSLAKASSFPPKGIEASPNPKIMLSGATLPIGESESASPLH